MTIEPWQKARELILESLTEARDKINLVLATALPADDDVILPRCELEALRNRSACLDALSEQNEGLVRELEECRQVISTTKSSQAQHKVLTQQQLKINSSAEQIARPFSDGSALVERRLVESSPGPPSSVLKDAEPSADARFQALSKKYNKLAENFKDLKTASMMSQEAAKKHRAKTEEWSTYASKLEKSIKKKDTRIAHSKEEADNLRSRVAELERYHNATGPGVAIWPSVETRLVEEVKVPEAMKDLIHVRGQLQESKATAQKLVCNNDYRKNIVAAKQDIIIELEEEVRELKSRIAGQELGSHSCQNAALGRLNATSLHQPRNVQQLLEYICCGPFHDNHNVLDRKALLGYVSRCDIPDWFQRSESTALLEYGIAGREDSVPSVMASVKAEPASQRNATETLDPELEFAHKATTISALPDKDFSTVAVESQSSTTQDTTPSPTQSCPSSKNAIQKELSYQISASPDIPIVTFSRSVTKRKRPDDMKEATPATKVKVERVSSSPVSLGAITFGDSMDLDEIGSKTNTPRKRRRTLETSTQAVKFRSVTKGVHGFPSAATCFFKRNNVVSNSNVSSTPLETGLPLKPSNANKRLLSQTPNASLSKQKRQASEDTVADIAEDGENARLVIFPPKSLRSTSNSCQQLESLLAQPSPPKRNLDSACLTRTAIPSTNPKTLSDSGKANKLTPHTLRHEHEYCLEQATPKLPPSVQEGDKQPDTFLRISRKTVLPKSSGNGQPLTPILSRGSRGSLTKTRKHVAEGKDRNPAFFTPAQLATDPQAYATTSRIAASGEAPSTKKRRHVKSKEQAFVSDVAPEHEPLRVRPVETLSVEDFRVNPDYNHGYKFAFSDVIRDQASRRCLPGCTKPECCGKKFRALAEAQRNPNDPLTMSQEVTDDRLLQEFLGDNADKLHNMAKAERDELLLQARTRELAKKHGKHRHAFERRKSPPGFWRTDFPTTQEADLDKEKAKDFERQLVAQRYEEAMRPQGAFLFRDE